MTNYKSFTQKIKSASTVEALEILDEKLDRLYNNGIFTVNEFCRLDDLILRKKFKLEH